MKIAVTCENNEVFQHFGHTPSFAVFTAFVTDVVVMVTALEIGVHLKFAFQKSSDDLIHIACRTADQLNPGFRQRHLRSSSDAAADQQIHAAFLQQPRQRSVSGLAAGQNPP